MKSDLVFQTSIIIDVFSWMPFFVSLFVCERACGLVCFSFFVCGYICVCHYFPRCVLAACWEVISFGVLCLGVALNVLWGMMGMITDTVTALLLFWDGLGPI